MGKEEIKWFLFINGIIVYIENPKESTKKLLELISEIQQGSRIQDICSKINSISIS